jgi:hypothetical protein
VNNLVLGGHQHKAWQGVQGESVRRSCELDTYHPPQSSSSDTVASSDSYKALEKERCRSSKALGRWPNSPALHWSPAGCCCCELKNPARPNASAGTLGTAVGAAAAEDPEDVDAEPLLQLLPTDGGCGKPWPSFVKALSSRRICALNDCTWIRARSRQDEGAMETAAVAMAASGQRDPLQRRHPLCRRGLQDITEDEDVLLVNVRCTPWTTKVLVSVAGQRHSDY